MSDLLKKVDKLAPWIFGLILLAGVPALFGAGVIDISSVNLLGRFLCLAIVALGIDLIWGYTGILSLCQAMFFCFGGYAMGMHLALHGPLDGDGIPRALFVVSSAVSGFTLPGFWKPFSSLPVAVLLAMLLPGLIAFVFGYFAFRSRVRGVYFSIITQATTVAAVMIFGRNETLLCGTNGLTNFVTIAGFDLNANSTKLGLYLLSAITLLVCYVLCYGVVSSKLGRLMVAVRDTESRLRFAGHNPVKIKMFAFTAAAVMAGIGGMLYTPQNGIITPSKMLAVESVTAVVWVAVGGRGTLRGAVVGALLINWLMSVTTSVAPMIWPFVLGGIFVAVVLLLPDGLVGAWNGVLKRMSESKRAPGQALEEEDANGAKAEAAAEVVS